MAWAALVGTILSAASKVQEGRNNKAWANYQAEQLAADQAANEGAARVHANNIISLGDRQRSAARAAAAASGVDVGEGSPVLIDQTIGQNAQHDAFMTLLDAQNAGRRSLAEQQGLRIQGNQSQQAGYIGAGTSLLSAYGNAQQSAWRRSS